MRGKERSEGGMEGGRKERKNPQTWAMKHYTKIIGPGDKENCESNETTQAVCQETEQQVDAYAAQAWKPQSDLWDHCRG